MADYKLHSSGVRRFTGEDIPADIGNRHWRTYLEWLANGNIPDSADLPPVLETELEISTRRLQDDPVFRALIKVLAAHFGLTIGQMVAEIRTQV